MRGWVCCGEDEGTQWGQMGTEGDKRNPRKQESEWAVDFVICEFVISVLVAGWWRLIGCKCVEPEPFVCFPKTVHFATL